MPFESKDDFKFETAPPSLRTVPVPVPELGPGGEFLVRELVGDERDNYEASLYRESRRGRRFNPQHATAKLCVLSIVNSQGERIFDESDIARLSTTWPAKVLQRIAKVAMEISGINEDEVETLTKN